jgi:hypothetical protein
MFKTEAIKYHFVDDLSFGLTKIYCNHGQVEKTVQRGWWQVEAKGSYLPSN